MEFRTWTIDLGPIRTGSLLAKGLRDEFSLEDHKPIDAPPLIPRGSHDFDQAGGIRFLSAEVTRP